MNIWVLDGKGQPDLYFKCLGSALDYLKSTGEVVVTVNNVDYKYTYELYQVEVV
jgi:hypothetical protein